MRLSGSGFAMKFLDKIRLFSHFLSSVQKRGLVRTIRISAYEFWYEYKFGARTGAVIPAEQLSYSSEARRHAQPYFPSSFLFLHEIFSSAYINCDNAVFVDYGCGMGRALLFASTRPFRRIVGIEISADLCEIARNNMNQYYRRMRRQSPEWSVVNVDARLFNVPCDAAVFYFYNPFDDVVLGEIIDRILDSLSKYPRHCCIVYANPVHQGVVLARGFKRIYQQGADFALFEPANVAVNSTGNIMSSRTQSDKRDQSDTTARNHLRCS